MVSTTQLINYVMNNDYEVIQKLIQSNQKINWDCRDRKGYYILHRAIETRAKECFDLLIDNNLVDISTGLTIAVKYYTQAPNPSNEYYLMKLININPSISHYYLCEFFDIPHMFTFLFSHHHKDLINIDNILWRSIEKCKPVIYNQVLDYLETEKPNFWVNFDNLKQSLFKYGIKYENTDILDFIKSKTNWKLVYGLPSIYQSLLDLKFSSFNHLMIWFEELDKNELEQIPNIKDLNYVFCDAKFDYLNKNFGDFFKSVQRIIKLKIDFNTNKIIPKLYKILIYKDYYMKFPINVYYIIWWLLQNKIIVNPYDNLITTNKLIIVSAELKNTYITRVLNSEKKIISQFDYIFSYFDHEPNDTIKGFLDKRDENFLVERKKFIDIMKIKDKEYNQTNTTKPKRKKNKEFDV